MDHIQFSSVVPGDIICCQFISAVAYTVGPVPPQSVQDKLTLHFTLLLNCVPRHIVG